MQRDIFGSRYWFLALIGVVIVSLLTGRMPQAVAESPVRASALQTAQTATSAPSVLQYKLHLGMMPMFDAALSFHAPGGGYGLSADIVSTQMFERFFIGRLDISGSGALGQAGLSPDLYKLRILDKAGKALKGYLPTSLVYRAGKEGVYPERIVPKPVTGAGRASPGALDPIAGLMTVMLHLKKTGTCPKRLTVFDGWREFAILFSSLPETSFPPSRGSYYSGPATGCAFEVRAAEAGKKAENVKSDYLNYLQNGKIFFAKLPDLKNNTLPMPILLEAGPILTRIRLYLASIGS